MQKTPVEGVWSIPTKLIPTKKGVQQCDEFGPILLDDGVIVTPQLLKHFLCPPKYSECHQNIEWAPISGYRICVNVLPRSALVEAENL